MKKIFLPIFYLAIILGAAAQNEHPFFIYKKDWSNAKTLKEAAYFMEEIKENDSTYLCRFYNKLGPIIKQESYSDEGLTTPNGEFFWYNKNGDIDSSGTVYKGRKDKFWTYYSNLKRKVSEQYDAGHLLKREEYEDDGYKVKGEGQTDPKQNAGADSTDSLKNIKVVQVKAIFKNGDADWTNYINKNLKTPARLMESLGSGLYKVVCSFLVDKEGNVAEVFLLHSSEWSADEAFIQILKKSPKWQPATQNGKKVIYRQAQEVTYSVD